MGYRANAIKTIGKTDFKGEGVATCAQKWKKSKYLQAQAIREVARGKYSAGLWFPTTDR